MASEIREWYRRAEVGTVSAAEFTATWTGSGSKEPKTVDVVLTHNIPDATEKRTYRQPLTVVDGEGSATVLRGPAVDVSGSAEHVRVLSPSKRLAFTATNPPEGSSAAAGKNGGNGGSSTRVNIVGADGCLATADCKKQHGKVLAVGSTFGGVGFSQEEDAVYYIALTSPPKETTWWGAKADEKEEPADLSTKYRPRDDWGEVHVGISETAIFCWRWREPGAVPERVDVKVPQVENKTLGELNVSGKRLVFVAWENGKGRRLGAAYCINRITAVYSSDLDGSNVKQLSDDGEHSCLSPRVSPDGARVVWLQAKADGPHRRACAVTCHSFEEETNTALTEPTLYIASLPYNCWISATELVFSHLTNSQIIVSHLDCCTKMLTDVPQTRETLGTWTVLDVCDRNVLVSFKSPCCPRGLFVFSFGPDSANTSSTTLIEPSNTTGLRFARYEDEEREQNVLVLLPPESCERKAPYPVLLVPHGGPHSCVPLDYMNLYAAFAYGGYAVVFPNYRGSLGFTDAALETLPGKAGTQDVEDVMALFELACKQEPQLDAARTFVFGGSHGGFLTAHLTAQYPDKFKAAAMRNPVIDISAMVYVSDIPDWCFVEAGLPIKRVSDLTTEDMAAMKKASPLPLVSRVTCPSLVLIGEKDLRVPPFQGRLWYYALREHGVETELFAYPDDSHPLSSIACASDVFVNVAMWFGRFL